MHRNYSGGFSASSRDRTRRIGDGHRALPGEGTRATVPTVWRGPRGIGGTGAIFGGWNCYPAGERKKPGATFLGAGRGVPRGPRGWNDMAGEKIREAERYRRRRARATGGIFAGPYGTSRRRSFRQRVGRDVDVQLDGIVGESSAGGNTGKRNARASRADTRSGAPGIRGELRADVEYSAGRGASAGELFAGGCALAPTDSRRQRDRRGCRSVCAAGSGFRACGGNSGVGVGA